MVQDATALAQAIHNRKTTASEVMHASLDRATEYSGLGAIAYLDPEYGLEQAEAYDNKSKNCSGGQQLFGGVPTLAKDLGGPFPCLPVAAGSRMYQRRKSGQDSYVSSRFSDAGLLPFGLTTTPEFGLSLSSEPAIGPACKNPLAEHLGAGGSSGGAASAVASGIVSIAHATDAGGSIRVPAACCGLVGFKPSRGAIPSGPGFGNHLGGIASEFAICRSVRDAEALFGIMTTPAPGPSAPVAFAKTFPQKLRIGVVEDTGLLFPTAVERAEAVLEASRVLEAQGHVLHPVQAADIATIAQGCGAVFEGIVSVNLATLAHQPGNDFSLSEKITQAALSTGKEISGVQLWQLMQSMVQLSHDFARLFDEVDCLLMPMLSSQPVRLGEFPTNHSDCGLHFKRMAGFAPLATIANVTGCPALTLPFGEEGDGLPLPVQLMVPMGHDRLTLKLAESLEMQERWQQRFSVAGMVQ